MIIFNKIASFLTCILIISSHATWIDYVDLEMPCWPKVRVVFEDNYLISASHIDRLHAQLIHQKLGQQQPARLYTQDICMANPSNNQNIRATLNVATTLAALAGHTTTARAMAARLQELQQPWENSQLTPLAQIFFMIASLGFPYNPTESEIDAIDGLTTANLLSELSQARTKISTTGDINQCPQSWQTLRSNSVAFLQQQEAALKQIVNNDINAPLRIGRYCLSPAQLTNEQKMRIQQIANLIGTNDYIKGSMVRTTYLLTLLQKIYTEREQPNKPQSITMIIPFGQAQQMLTLLQNSGYAIAQRANALATNHLLEMRAIGVPTNVQQSSVHPLREEQIETILND